MPFRVRLGDYWRIESVVKPVKFYPYTSIVYRAALEIRDYQESPEFKNLKIYLINLFNGAGIKAQDDNKIVFECVVGEQTIFYGFHDFTLRIGFQVSQRDY